jgi:hypothetical protein
MVRGTLVVDTKLLKDHFLRQQRGGNIAGYRGARFQRGYGIGGIFKSLARYAIPLFKQGAKIVGKRALQAATEVGQDVLQGKNVGESVKTHGGEIVKDFAEQGARTLLRQTGHGSKRRRSQRSNLSSVKKQNWKTQDVPNGLWKMKATTLMKAATTMNLKAKRLKQATIYIRSIKITKTPKRYALRSRPY